MEQQLPIYFTKRGRGWRNTQRLVTLRYKKDGKKIHTFQLQDCHLKRGSFSIQGQRANGYYIDQDTGELVRITNLTGAKKGELRLCPNLTRAAAARICSGIRAGAASAGKARPAFSPFSL